MLESKIKENKFNSLIIEEDIEKAKISMYKWLARGLKPEMSVKKVMVDLEIEINGKYKF